MKNKLKIRNWSLVADLIILVALIASLILFKVGVIGNIMQGIIIALCYLVLVPVVVTRLRYGNANRKFKGKTEEMQSWNVFRGGILDETFRGHISRKPDENDWDFVKRIFTIIHDVNPEGSLEMLFCKSIDRLDEDYKLLANNFMLSSQSKKDVEILFKSLGENDPANRLISVKPEIGEKKLDKVFSYLKTL